MNLPEFFSASIQLAEEGGRIIRRVHESKELGLKQKGEGGFNPVTIADLMVQRTIECNLEALFPEVDIIGEETDEALEHIQPTMLQEHVLRDLVRPDMLEQKWGER